MSDPVELVLSRLVGVRARRRGTWVAHCPAHKDRSPSLSVAVGQSGAVLLKCFAGCDIHQITQAIDLGASDLFPAQPDGKSCNGARAADRPPYSVRDMLVALSREMHLVWVLLSDIANGREIGPAERARGAKARERCQALIQELQRFG